MKKQRYYVVETHNGCWPVEKSSKVLKTANFLSVIGKKVGRGEDALPYREAVKLSDEMNKKYANFYKED
jgi:hypothetical protein